MSYFPSGRNAGFTLTQADEGLVNSRVLAVDGGLQLVDTGTSFVISASALEADDAPYDATYLTLTTNGTLTNERTIVVSSPLAFVDGGAGGNYTISLGTVGIANGGTGQTTQTAGFDALSPTTTKGDLIVHDGTDNVRQAAGANNQLLTYDSAQANGVKATWGGFIGVATQTSNFTLVAASASIQLVDATSGAIAATLPLASAAPNKIYSIKKIDSVNANDVTVTRAGSDTIDGLTTFVLGKRYDAVTLCSDGTNWYVI